MRAAILILAVFAAGCAPLWDYSPRTPLEEEADYQRTRSGYKQLATARVKELKYSGGLATPTISPLRKSHAVAIACRLADAPSLIRRVLRGPTPLACASC